MKIKRYLTLGASVLAMAALTSAAGASVHKIYRPYNMVMKPIDPNKPMHHFGPHLAPYVAPPKAKSGTWTDVGCLPFKKGPWGEMLMTDGTVIILDYCTNPAQWYKLTPDSTGNYTDGTWTSIAEMPSGYSPLFFAQQVLPNGNVIINGGEYNDCDSDWGNGGALYDYTANTWSTVTAPSGWKSIGDAESVILPDGDYMLASCCFFSTGEDIIATISGTTVNWGTEEDTWSCNGGACMDEEGFTLLPDGDVFLVDVWNHTKTSDEYWIYDTSTASWTEEGSTPNYLSSTSTYELGPAPLTPLGGTEGTIIQYSANTTSGVNDIYSVANGTWTSGPVMKVSSTIYDMADAPSVTLPSGHVLVQASPGTFSTPSHFWEWSLGPSLTNKVSAWTATQVNDTKEADDTSSFEGNLLMLPTGQAMWDNSQATNEVSVYTPVGSPSSAWLPVVSSVATTLTVGSTGNTISGTNFNGFDLGGSYGDDAQQATNWPLVRFTNTSSGDVCFARSYNFSTMGVWTSGTTSATFDIPSGCETGASTLQVIVNGIASSGTAVTLND
jgi:hypothetical protein